MIAKNALYESEESVPVRIVIKKTSRVSVGNLTANDVTMFTVLLKWQSTIVDATFKISFPMKRGYPPIEPIYTNETSYLGK